MPRAPTQSPDLLEGFGCGSRPSMRSSADTELRTEAEAPRAIVGAYASITYDTGAAQFGDASSAASRLHPTWLLSFTQHPRGASAPAARMSYTIFLSGLQCRRDRKAN